MTHFHIRAICLFLFSWLLNAQQIFVVVTIPALGLIAQDIGGQYVQIEKIYQSHYDPHFVHLQPSQFLKLKEANIILCEQNFSKKIKDQINDIIFINENSRDHNIEHHHHDQGSDHTHNEFALYHEWLSFEYASQLASLLSQKLSELLPEHQEFFFQRALAFQENLQQLKKKFRETSSKKSIIYHNSFYHLEKELHRTFGPVLIACEESSFTPQSLQEIISNQTNYKNLIVEKTTPETMVHRLKKQIHLPIVVVDTLGYDNYSSYNEYLETVLKNF
jgi:zinc transport system substrate-binding protein